MGRFYSIGIGPGDPELLTLKAINTIKESDVICAPHSGTGDSCALEIVKSYLTTQKVELVAMPMSRKEEVVENAHQVAVEKICQILDQGKVVSFLTLGDPTIYSTAFYIHERIAEKGYQAKIIPGISSFCSAAAQLGISLSEKSDSLHIIPSSYERMDFLTLSGTKVLMKSGKSLEKVCNYLEEYGDNHEVYMVERATLPDERCFRSIQEIPKEASYFSLLILKEKEGKK